MDEFQSHKSGYCWKLGEAGDRTNVPKHLQRDRAPPCTFTRDSSLQTHQKASPCGSLPWKGFAAAVLASMLNEQTCLSLQLATHDPASDRASNHFIFINNVNSPLVFRQPKLHSPACKALHRMLRSHSISQIHCSGLPKPS